MSIEQGSIPLFGGGLQVFEGPGKLLRFFVRPVLHRELNGQSLPLNPQTENLQHFGIGQLHYGTAAVRMTNHQPFILETLQSLPDRWLSDAKLPRNAGLDDPFARMQLATDDQFAQKILDLLSDAGFLPQFARELGKFRQQLLHSESRS